MAVNWATASLGASLVDCSSETETNEALNILDPRPAKLWLSSEGLPQWLSISLLGLKDIDRRSVCIRTIGWRCWHAYRTNPRKVTLHVSADGAKFRVWDKFVVPRPASGTHLFCCAPISISIYPYIALEVTHTFGGLQTYINRVYFYTDEIPASPLAGSTKLESTSNSSIDIQSQSDIDIEDKSISIIKVQESATKDIQQQQQKQQQVVTQSNEDTSFSLIDNLTATLDINNRNDVVEKKVLNVEKININPGLPETPAGRIEFLDTSTSPDNNTNDRSTSPSGIPTNIRRLSATSSPIKSSVISIDNLSHKKTSEKSTSPRRLSSNYHEDEGSSSLLSLEKKRNQEINDKDNRIQYLEEKVSKLESLITNSVEIGKAIKIAKDKTGRIRNQFNRRGLRKGFADDSSDDDDDDDDDDFDEIINPINNNPLERKNETLTVKDSVAEMLEGVDSKLTSIYNQVTQSDKNIELAPSLSYGNSNETFDIVKLRSQYLTSNEIESLLNPLKTTPSYEIPHEILYGDILEGINQNKEVEEEILPSISKTNVIDVRQIETDLKERSDVTFQAIGDLVKTLHLKVKKKILKETQLKLLKKKLERRKE